MPENQATQPTQEEATLAHDHVMANIYHPVFFNKLASFNVVPRNRVEAEQLLYLGAQLYGKHQEKAAAEAEKRGSFLDFAVSRFDSLAGQDARGGVSDAQVKQATAGLMGRPDVAAAASTLARALAAVA